jgi:hypothetical protein
MVPADRRPDRPRQSGAAPAAMQQRTSLIERLSFAYLSWRLIASDIRSTKPGTPL